MTTLTFLDLTVTQGPNLGMRYRTPENMFRILGRYEKGFIADERPLNPDQQELILKYIPKEFRHSRAPDILLDDPLIGIGHGLVFYTKAQTLWVDLLSENTQSLQLGDLIYLGSTQLKVS